MGFDLGIVAAAETVIALVFHVIGFASPYWIKFDGLIDGNYGLWQACIMHQCTRISNRMIAEWLTVSRVFASIGLLLLGLASLFSIAKLALPKMRKVSSVLAILGCILSAVSILVAVCIFASKMYGSNFHFAFVFEIVATLLSGCSGIIHLVDTAQKWKTNAPNTAPRNQGYIFSVPMATTEANREPVESKM